MGGRPGPVGLALVCGGLVLLVPAIVLTRVMLSSRADLAEGDQAAARGDVSCAVDCYERAARMVGPGSSAPRRALARLDDLAARAQRDGDLALERAALEAQRRALLGSRALWPREPERLARVNARLGELLARGDPAGDEAARRRWHAARLAASDAPGPAFAVLAVLGFGLWVAAGVALALRGVGKDDRWRPKGALPLGALVVLGMALWLLGLWRA
jgi:hypothetical protein